MAHSRTRFLTHTALYLALAVVLPIGFHSFGLAGRLFLPMHVPVLLAGFLVGPGSGLLVGLFAPGLSHLLSGMPSGTMAPVMTFELPVYGLIAGLALKYWRLNIYLGLVLALVAGRLAFAGGLVIMGSLVDLPYDVTEYLSFAAGGALMAGLPGVIMQLILIPPIVAIVRRTHRDELVRRDI